MGGAQAVAAHIAQYAPADVQVDYVVFGSDIGEYEPLVEAHGSQVFHVSVRKRRPLDYLKKMKAIIRDGRYDVVHAHTMFSCGTVAIAAWLAGAPGRISHSHTNRQGSTRGGLVHRLYRGVMRRIVRWFSTEHLACGVDAGGALYGDRWFAKHGTVLQNGIDMQPYAYSPETRARIRAERGAGDRFVIGHVGHYLPVKNQEFLVRLMPDILKQNPNAALWLLGDGDDREKLAARIEELKLSDSVWLAGNVDNVSEMLSAMDVFAFPSLFEGTPLALIEAQANGVPCVISDAIPKDAWLTDLIVPLSLSEDPAVWVDRILAAERHPDHDYASDMAAHYDDIQTSMNKLYAIYDKYHRREKHGGNV